MTIREKIGQKMIVGIEGTQLNKETIDILNEYKFGNIIYFARNLVNKEQILKLSKDLQETIKNATGHYAFITTDQEGGTVTRLPEDCTNVPGAMAIGGSGNPENAYKAGDITARELKALGINFDLAPSVDINNNRANPVIGTRSYGEDTKTVVKYSKEVIKAFLDNNILCCAKHFPGHGDTHVDSHLSLPRIDKSYEEIKEMELVPFKGAIDAGIPGVLTSHILFPKIDSEFPATVSRKFNTKILKEDLGFKGLVVTDCMEMDAIQMAYGTPKAVLMAMEAGVDLAIVSHTIEEAIKTMELIEKAWEENEIDIEEFENSVEKILKYKSEYELLPNGDINMVGGEENKKISRGIMEETISYINRPKEELPDLGDNPYFVGSQAYRATVVGPVDKEDDNFPRYMANKLNGKYINTDVYPKKEEIDELIKGLKDASSITIGTYNAHLNTEQLDMIDSIRKAYKDKDIIVVSLRNPYDLMDLDKTIYTLAAFEYSPNSFDVLVDILNKKIKPKGEFSF